MTAEAVPLVSPEAGTVPEPVPCAACGEPRLGRYCHACGERGLHPDDESLAHVLREQFHEVTSADGRMWRTLRALFAPGKLTEEYFAGRRGLYLRPVRLFLVVNVLFFLVLVPLGGQGFRGGAALYRAEPALAAQMDRAAAAAGLPRVAYDAAFDQRADTLSRTLIAVLVPLLALVFAVVLWPARASAARHLVFASHFVVAMMGATLGIALAIILAWALWAAVLRRPSFAVGDPVLVPVMVVALATYLVLGIRRVYGVPRWVAGATGLAIATVGMAAVLHLYRLLLFYATLWTLDVPA